MATSCSAGQGPPKRHFHKKAKKNFVLTNFPQTAPILTRPAPSAAPQTIAPPAPAETPL
jgi:hypothetical protein